MTVNDSPSPPETVLSETHGDARITVHDPVGTLGDSLRRSHRVHVLETTVRDSPSLLKTGM